MTFIYLFLQNIIMNILMVNITDVEGRHFNGLDLMQMLNKKGHNVHMITMTKKSTEDRARRDQQGQTTNARRRCQTIPNGR